MSDDIDKINAFMQEVRKTGEWRQPTIVGEPSGEIHLATDDGRPVLILVPPGGIPVTSAVTFIKAVSKLMREMPEVKGIKITLETT